MFIDTDATSSFDLIETVPGGNRRFQTIMSALDGLTIQQAKDFLWRISDELDRQKVISSAADNPTDAALLDLAAALG